MTKLSRSHGTYTAYFWFSCRCDPCRNYQSARVARNRAARLASGNLNHGSRSAYDAGCRCMACTNARQVAAARLNETNRQVAAARLNETKRRRRP